MGARPAIAESSAVGVDTEEVIRFMGYDRLRKEGVEVNDGKVNMQIYRWEPGLDELLWKPSSTWDEA